MTTSAPLRRSIVFLAPLLLVCAAAGVQPTPAQGPSAAAPANPAAEQAEESAMKVQYLEIVTPSVNDTCDALAKMHGVVFGEPVAELGNARTANLADGGRIGVRGAMHAAETPVTRPYALVDDIEAAIETAKTAGAEVAVPPMKIPGQGTIAIYVLGGIEHGLWQL